MRPGLGATERRLHYVLLRSFGRERLLRMRFGGNGGSSPGPHKGAIAMKPSTKVRAGAAKGKWKVKKKAGQLMNNPDMRAPRRIEKVGRKVRKTNRQARGSSQKKEAPLSLVWL